MNIDAVHQRSGDLRDIALDHGRRAVALAGFVITKTAGTRIHGRRQHESRGERERHSGASDRYGPIFQRLAQNFQNIAGKLRKLVQK